MNARISDVYFQTLRAYLSCSRYLLPVTMLLERALWREHARGSSMAAIRNCVVCLNRRLLSLSIALSQREKDTLHTWCMHTSDLVSLLQHRATAPARHALDAVLSAEERANSFVPTRFLMNLPDFNYIGTSSHPGRTP